MDIQDIKNKKSYKLLKKEFLNNILKDNNIGELILYFPKTKTEVNILINNNILTKRRFIIRELSVFNFLVNQLYINNPKTINFGSISESMFEELNIDSNILRKFIILQNEEYWSDKKKNFEEYKELEKVICQEIYNFMLNNIKNVQPKSFFSNDKTKWFADFYYSYNDENDFLNKIKTNFEHALYCFWHIMKYDMDKNYQSDFIVEENILLNNKEIVFKIKNYKFIIGTIFDKTFNQVPYIKSFKKIIV